MIWILIAIIFGSVVLDQLSKWLAVVYLQGEVSFPLWKDVLHLTFVKNEGAAFGMLADHRWVFMIFSSVAIVGLSIYLFGFCKENKLVKICLAMIIGGGIGNMIDRVALGYVVDFIDFTLIDFAVFNIADSCVCVGTFMLSVWLVIDTVKAYKKEKAEKEAKEQEE